MLPGLSRGWPLQVGRPSQQITPVLRPALSEHTPRLSSVLGSQRPSSTSFISIANMITISPLGTGHLPVSKVLSRPVHPH